METELTCRPAACRPETHGHRCRAVERAIRAMRECLSDPLSLRDMARTALMSPYHFNRVFSQITGIPPFQFLTALRLEAAKRLLLTTDRSVTDICFDVGYNSLGSFITRFTLTVGQSPRHLRRLRENGALCCNHTPCPDPPVHSQGEALGIVRGHVSGPESFTGRVFVGLFPAPIPQARPVGCAVLPSLGPYVIEHIPDGSYHVLALGVPDDAGLRAYALCEDTLRGRAGPVGVRGGHTTGPTALTLRPARLTDVPILVALPFLLRSVCPDAGQAAFATPFRAEATGKVRAGDETEEMSGQGYGAGEGTAIDPG